MPGTVVLNPATVDGYGNPISVTRDEGAGVNRLLTSGQITGKPPFRLFDGDGNQVDIITEGGEILLGIRDLEQNDLLYKILREMKRMNKYMQYMMEEKIDDDDLED